MDRNEKFEEYFRKYKDLVIRVVMRKSGDYQLAQEICQQVFCAFYIHMKSVDEDLVKAWLMRCTQNAVVDYLRKPSTRNEMILDVDLRENGNALAQTSIDYYENRVINQELTGRILREVRSANEAWYNVLVMICVDGLSHKEAAEKLNISEQVLRARLYRARGFVREKFGDEYRGN